MSGQWTISGYAGLEEVFSETIGDLEEPEVERMLQRLASRHLSEREVVSASLRRSMKEYAPSLEVERSGGKQFTLTTTGTDFHYTARYTNA